MLLPSMASQQCWAPHPFLVGPASHVVVPRARCRAPGLRYSAGSSRPRRVACHATIPVPDKAPLETDLDWDTDFSSHYVKGKLIGQGSFGSVYLGIDLHTGQQVAIKVMPKQRGKLSKARTLEKLIKEVGILQRVQDCPNVVRLLGTYEGKDEVMVVTELCEGGDLQKLSDDLGALPERAVALIGYEVLKVVATCHRHNVLHGDVKPANFVLKHRRDNPLYSPDLNLLFSPWLIAIDFGCSQYLTSKRFNKRTGTPVYMAPEIFERDYHWEADMWSVGIMLYQLYARRFPFWDTYEACRSAKLDEVQVLVQEGPLPLDYGPWLHMSEAGLNFMRGCLERDYASRMTVDEALDHPWFDNWLPEEEAGPAALDSMSTSEDEEFLATPAAAAAGGRGSSRVAAVPHAGSVAAAALQQQAAAAGAAARRLLQRPAPPGHKPQPLGSSGTASPPQQQQPQQPPGSVVLPPKQLVHPSGVPLAAAPGHKPQAVQHPVPQLQPLPAVAAGQPQEPQQSVEQQRQQHHQLRATAAAWQQQQQAQQQAPSHSPPTGSSGSLRSHPLQDGGRLQQQPVALEQMQEVSSNGTGGADVPAAVEPAPAAAHNKAG